MSGDSSHTVRGPGTDDGSSTVRGAPSVNSDAAASRHVQTLSWNSVQVPGEHTSLLQTVSEINSPSPSKSYGATPQASDTSIDIGITKVNSADVLGKVVFWLFIVCLIAPLMLIVCLICWGLVVTIPMAKLNWVLIKHLFSRPDSIRFCAAPPAVVVAEPNTGVSATSAGIPHFSVKHPRISAGQVAPSGFSKVLLCTYRAVGLQYYKYTIGGVRSFPLPSYMLTHFHRR